MSKNQEIILTLFWMGCDLFFILGLYHKGSGYFENSEDSFHIGAFNGVIGGLVLSRIPKFSYRTAYCIFATLVRAFVITPKDKGLLFVQITFLIFSVFLDIDKEKNDKNLFTSYFNSKQQLLKFKNLVAQEIPEGIVVLTKDIKECLFVNNYFMNLVEDYNVVSQLDQFIFQENLDQPRRKSSIYSNNSPLNPKSLLSFLKSENIKEIHNSSTERVSYILTYKKRKFNDKFDEEKNYIFEAKIVPLVWDNQSAIAIILDDITEQHTVLNLKIAHYEKDRIIASVSHELRTPLNCILGMVQIMIKKVQDPEILRYLSICQNSGNLLIGLVNSLLDLHQIQANKFKLNPEEIDLKQMLQDLRDLFEYQCTQKGLHLILDISPSLLSSTLFY